MNLLTTICADNSNVDSRRVAAAGGAAGKVRRGWSPRYFDATASLVVLVLVVLLWAVAANAEPPAASLASSPDTDPVEIRCRGSWLGYDIFFSQGKKFQESHPQVAVRYRGSNTSSLEDIKELAEGRLEIAVLMGPVYPTTQTAASPGDARHDLLLDALTKSKCDYAVLGRSAMAVVVHPQNPLQEIDQTQIERILRHKITSWKAVGQEDRPIQIITDERACEILRACANAGPSGIVSAWNIPNGLEQLAREQWAIGFMCIDKRLTGSGLKILPVRPTGGKEAVLPSPENVVAGKYPYFSYLLVASRPGASPVVLEFRKTLQAPELARWFASWDSWLVKLDYTLPGEAREEMWPAPDDKAAMPSISGAAAVLPLESLSADFVMAGSSHRAVYEQAVADAIAKDGRLKVVDRTELARVLKEHKLKLAHSVLPPRAILTADVLVFSYVVTTDSRSYLLVQAVHAATTSCLGRMKLPIDSARPEEFAASVSATTARWWPGVLRNLAAALARPVWTLLPPILPEHASSGLTAVGRVQWQRVDNVQAALEEKLLTDQRVFYAHYSFIPDAQREVLMGLLGISRPASSRFTPAADYLLQSEAVEKGGIRLRVRRGSDLQVVRETALETTAQATAAGDWIAVQLAGLREQPARPAAETSSTAAPSAAAAQAAQELQQIAALRKQCEAFRKAAQERYLAAKQWNYLADDKKELDRREEEIGRHYQRAAQLDPTCETAAYEAAGAACKGDGYGYESNRRAVDVFTRFLDVFPHSKHAGTLASSVSDSYTLMARDLEEDVYMSSLGSHRGVPRGLERTKLVEEYRRGAIVYMIRSLGPTLSEKLKAAASDPASNWRKRDFQRRLDSYVAGNVSEAEFEEVAAEYSRTLDSFPGIVPPGDFQRLHYLAAKKKKEAFVDLLFAMQKRWPDPNDVHWKLGKDQALDDLCALFQTDPRGTSFYQWLRDKHGIGDLPWKGYDPKEHAESSTVEKEKEP